MICRRPAANGFGSRARVFRDLPECPGAAHPDFGQGHRSLGPHEETLAQQLFELPDLLADCARRHMKLVGRPCEAQAAGDRIESAR